MSKPTCLGILNTLVDSGYLLCDQRTKTYALGPALIPAGRLAQQSFAAADVADRLLAALSERYQAPCTASAVIGEHIVVLASTAPHGRSPAVTVGSATPSRRRSG